LGALCFQERWPDLDGSGFCFLGAGNDNCGREIFSLVLAAMVTLASTLHRLALEQSGEVMPTRDFKQWMAKNNLSLSAAAVELGFTRRTITAYSSGAALIPKHVALACRGWEYEHR